MTMLIPGSVPSAFSSAADVGAAKRPIKPIAVTTNRALQKSRISLPLCTGASRALASSDFVTPDRRGANSPRGGASWQSSELKLLDHHRLVARRRDPFLDLRHRHDRIAIGVGLALEFDLIGAEAGRDRRIHRIGNREVPEQEIAASLTAAGTAIAPDR